MNVGTYNRLSNCFEPQYTTPHIAKNEQFRNIQSILKAVDMHVFNSFIEASPHYRLFQTKKNEVLKYYMFLLYIRCLFMTLFHYLRFVL